MRTALIIFFFLGASAFIFYFSQQQKQKEVFVAPINNQQSVAEDDSVVDRTQEMQPIQVPETALIDLPRHYYQTFNNCGPATLSMVLNYYGDTATQKEIGDILRPYQVASGDNDDKSVSLEEMAAEAEKRGFVVYYRTNGTIDLLKKLTANNIPVVVETWLVPTDDVGHYRVVTGYNETTKQIIQDDSYQGPDKYYSYDEFLSLWQAFHYQYLVLVEQDRADLLKQIIAEEADEKVAWENTVKRAEAEMESGNPYPILNQSIAYYHLGDYEKSVELFEQVENQLPRRMLWYENEPILAYKELKNYDRVFSLTNTILNGGNKAASELYKIRGDVYKEQGNLQAAQEQYDLAVLYNKNYAQIVNQ